VNVRSWPQAVIAAGGLVELVLTSASDPKRTPHRSRAMTLTLPYEYQQFVAAHGASPWSLSGGEMPGYVYLWELTDIPGCNSDIRIHEFAPGFLAFGGDGGGEILVFDASGAVYMLPLIGMEPAVAIKLADSFTELASRFEPIE
jgi:hypothetical protein